MEIKVNLGKDSHSIYIEKGIIGRAGDYIRTVFSGKRVMIVSDDHVFPLYGKQLLDSINPLYECHSLVLPHGESTKAFETLPAIYNALLDAGITRSDLIIALGGGVIGDLTGFAASSYLRGTHFIQIPTSLLAQVDSSVGGKVAVDLPQGKNLVGAFFQPDMVLIDPSILDSLNEHFIHDGMGEVIKYGCIWDKELFQLLIDHSSFEDLKPILPEIICRCVDIKRTVVEHDQFDKGERMLLNFGHTLAHTIEQHFHYERESHGEAVGIGMYQISRMAEKDGLTKPGTAELILKALDTYGLPHECGVPMEELIGAISRDKKNLNNKLNIVLLEKIGKSYVHPETLSFFTDRAKII